MVRSNLSRACTSKSTATCLSKVSKKKNRNYSEENLEKAKLAVLTKKRSAYRAAAIYEVPKSTLLNQFKGVSRQIGRKPAFNADFEELIADALIKISEYGYGLSFIRVQRIIKDYVEKEGIPNQFINNTPGKSWWRGFKKRNPRITMRRAQNIPVGKVKALTTENLDNFYQKLQEKYDELSLHLRPTHIFNCDETGFSGDKGKKKIICSKSVILLFFN